MRRFSTGRVYNPVKVSLKGELVGNAFQIGAWLAQPSLNTISLNGKTTHLEPKVMEVLVCLAAHAGETIPKEKLIQTVWPDTFVTDDVLTRSISELRRVFEDDAKDSHIIQTIPKRGYRLLAPVVPMNGTSVASTATPKISEPGKVAARAGGRKLRFGALGLGGAVLLIGLLAIANAGRIRTLLGRDNVPPIHSLAVLPLQNLSGDPSQEYFAYGMTEELITDLSQVSALRVASHQSVLRFKKSDKPLPEIARELNVDALVTGSVQRAGDRIRITAQLIYAPEDKNVLAKSYERDFQNVLALQSSLAGTIADEIRIKMSPAEITRLAKSRTVSPGVLDAYWKGQYHLSVLRNSEFANGQEGLADQELSQALSYFELAIQKDPNYALAYLGLYDAIDRQVNSMDPASDFSPKRREALAKVLALDDTLPRAHLEMANLLFYADWNWAGAEKEYKRALELDPNSATSHDFYANFLDSMGRLEEGQKEHALQLQLDPDLDNVDDSPLTPLELQIERKRLYIETHQRINSRDYWMLGVLLARAHRHEEAVGEWQKMLIHFGYEDVARAMKREYTRAGYEGALRVWADAFEPLAKKRYLPEIMMAFIHGELGDKDRAFAWAEKAYVDREGSMAGLTKSMDWYPLRSDPRFPDLVRRVGLPQ